MSMTLHRLGREEILSQLRRIAGETRGKWDFSEVIIPGRARDGKAFKRHVIKVKDTPEGAFLYPFDADLFAKDLLKLAPLMGSDMRELDFEGLLSRLDGCTSDDVWLQWHREGDEPSTVVGKILGVVVDGKLTVSLFPVPKDIEEVNREVHRRVAMDCVLAEGGIECGDCPKVGSCRILEKVDRQMTKERSAEP